MLGLGMRGTIDSNYMYVETFLLSAVCSNYARACSIAAAIYLYGLFCRHSLDRENGGYAQNEYRFIQQYAKASFKSARPHGPNISTKARLSQTAMWNRPEWLEMHGAYCAQSTEAHWLYTIA